VSEIDHSSGGYPEEAPPGADPDGGSGPSEESPAGDHADDAPDHDDGKATGNPHDAD
jgi:hypothetical protein